MTESSSVIRGHGVAQHLPEVFERQWRHAVGRRHSGWGDPLRVGPLERRSDGDDDTDALALPPPGVVDCGHERGAFPRVEIVEGYLELDARPGHVSTLESADKTLRPAPSEGRFRAEKASRPPATNHGVIVVGWIPG